MWKKKCNSFNLFKKKFLNTLNTVGYKEFFDYFQDNMNREEAIDKIKPGLSNHPKVKDALRRANEEFKGE